MSCPLLPRVQAAYVKHAAMRHGVYAVRKVSNGSNTIQIPGTSERAGARNTGHAIDQTVSGRTGTGGVTRGTDWT